jgi:hypothetical protein
MGFAKKKELFEERVRYFTKKYLGIRLDAITVLVVAVMILVVLALLIFDIVEF